MESLQSSGFNCYLYDTEAEKSIVFEQKKVLCKILPQVTHLLVTAAPSATEGDPGLSLLEGCDKEALKSIEWVGYLSTIGVYGDRLGGVVDETATADTQQARSILRRDTEQKWLESGLPVHIFRLPGIYGPGRGVLCRIKESSGYPRVYKPGQYFNRAHVDDIVSAVLASAARPSPGRVYNIADDLPAAQHVVVEYACRLLGVAPSPLLPFDKAELSPMARSFYAENKRVSNTRMKEELGVTLQYPTYKEGLLAQLEAEGGEKPQPPSPIGCILMGNGSKQSAAALSARHLATDLNVRLGGHVTVKSASVKYSDKIPLEELEGQPAELARDVLSSMAKGPFTRIVILPHFLGQSQAIDVTKIGIALEATQSKALVHMARPLVDTSAINDYRMAHILADKVRQVCAKHDLDTPRVVLCDHGSPMRAVAEGRRHLMAQLQTVLGNKVASVTGAAMERRPEPEYDFNGPLLSDVFDQKEYAAGRVVVALLFLLPGKHAGPGGDIATILAEAEKTHPGLQTYMTDVIDCHPVLLDILEERYLEALDGPSM